MPTALLVLLVAMACSPGMRVLHVANFYILQKCRRFVHGRPAAPCRVRTNKGSSFVCIQVSVLSCRSDGLRDSGSLKGVWGKHAVNGGRDPVPLQMGSASVECNTSGVFYKGFPRVEWLQVRSWCMHALLTENQDVRNSLFPTL